MKKWALHSLNHLAGNAGMGLPHRIDGLQHVSDSWLVDALVDLWNAEISLMVDITAPRCSILDCKVCIATPLPRIEG